MTQYVFEPLGMNQTGFGAPGSAALHDQPWGHVDVGSTLTPKSPDATDADNPAAMGPAGTVHSTLVDYTKFMLAHIAGERGTDSILTSSTFQFLHAPFQGQDYGMGWEINTEVASVGTILEHTGTNLRWRAQVGLVPELELGILIVTNAGGNEAQEAVDSLSSIMAMCALATP
jgi:CubicO group peptidase (beta-lactamase class C family)